MRYARLFEPYRGYWEIQVDEDSATGGYHGYQYNCMFDGCKTFKAFDVSEGRFAGNLLYASLMENTEETRKKLQKLADLNWRCNLILQLRRKNKVCFQTK